MFSHVLEFNQYRDEKEIGGFWRQMTQHRYFLPILIALLGISIFFGLYFFGIVTFTQKPGGLSTDPTPLSQAHSHSSPPTPPRDSGSGDVKNEIRKPPEDKKPPDTQPTPSPQPPPSPPPPIEQPKEQPNQKEEEPKQQVQEQTQPITQQPNSNDVKDSAKEQQVKEVAKPEGKNKGNFLALYLGPLMKLKPVQFLVDLVYSLIAKLFGI